MAHYVLCSVCGQRFDRDKVQAVKSGTRRYAHYTCDPAGEKVPLADDYSPELQELKDYIAELFGNDVNWALVTKQIKKYQEENGYSLTGILKSLKYFFEIKNGDKDKSHGIGIVPFVYQDAYTYYYNLYLAQQATQDKVISNQVIEIVIPPPKSHWLRKKLFDLGVKEDEE